jgi:hypothetical protein
VPDDDPVVAGAEVEESLGDGDGEVGVGLGDHGDGLVVGGGGVPGDRDGRGDLVGLVGEDDRDGCGVGENGCVPGGGELLMDGGPGEVNIGIVEFGPPGCCTWNWPAWPDPGAPPPGCDGAPEICTADDPSASVAGVTVNLPSTITPATMPTTASAEAAAPSSRARPCQARGSCALSSAGGSRRRRRPWPRRAAPDRTGALRVLPHSGTRARGVLSRLCANLAS